MEGLGQGEGVRDGFGLALGIDAAVDGFLHSFRGKGMLGGNLFGQCQGEGLEIRAGCDVVDYAEPVGLLGGPVVCGEEELLGLCYDRVPKGGRTI